jgi:protein CLEC16A
MAGDPLLAIKSYSLLFINLKNEMWISYILCQPFLMEAITLKCESKDEEYTEYFVSFLKSLSIRINSSQITLFYNKVTRSAMQEKLHLPLGDGCDEVLQPP